ncbi:MAG: hypothetical protein U0X20_16780 [Caldilineaceae bacterium]
MSDNNPGQVDTAEVQRMAAHNGVRLDPERAAALVPFVQGLLEADARLAALDLGTLPAAGLPWAPFGGSMHGEGGSGHGG